MKVMMVPEVDISMQTTEPQTKCGMQFTFYFEWEGSGRCNEKDMGEKEKKAPKEMLPKWQEKGPQPQL